MTPNPFFTIVIPTLNEEKCLPLLLSDISKQTFTDYEVIVADGKSADNTREKAEHFAHVRVIESPQRNVSFQRNFGAHEALGEYLIFFDADTRIPPYFLEGIKYRITITAPDLFTTWLAPESARANDKNITRFINMVLEAGKVVDYPWAMGAMVGCRKEAFEHIGGFNPNLSFGEDAQFVMDAVSQKYRFKIYRDPRYIFSLRRFRKEGTIRMLRKYAAINLKAFIMGFPEKCNTYPMLGGAYYHAQKKPYPRLLAELDRFFQKLKPANGQKRLQKVWETLFAD